MMTAAPLKLPLKIKNKTVFKFEQWFKFLLNDSSRIEQTIIYIIVLIVMTILYAIYAISAIYGYIHWVRKGKYID